MSQERRELKRRHIMFYSRVFSRRTGEFIGYLGNLTAKGLMIICDHPIETGQEYSLRIDLPEDIYQRAILAFEANCIWCEEDIDPNFYNAGFQLLDISDADCELVERIVADYGFRDL